MSFWAGRKSLVLEVRLVFEFRGVRQCRLKALATGVGVTLAVGMLPWQEMKTCPIFSISPEIYLTTE